MMISLVSDPLRSERQAETFVPYFEGCFAKIGGTVSRKR